MHKRFVLVFALLILAGCGTATIYTAKSDGDIDELYASCVGPVGTSYINYKSEPFLFISARKEEGSTIVYLSKYHSYEEQKVNYPPSATFIIDGERVKVEKDNRTFEGSIVPDAVVYKHTTELDTFSFDIGSVRLNSIDIDIEPIEFTYEERRFLMCVQ